MRQQIKASSAAQEAFRSSGKDTRNARSHSIIDTEIKSHVQSIESVNPNASDIKIKTATDNGKLVYEISWKD